jgi:aminoglycoside phosphotransferase (APT) family kinase protein
MAAQAAPAAVGRGRAARGAWTSLGDFPLPSFVRDAVQRLLAEEAPAHDRAPVLSHNDVNPTNLVYDGEQLLLLDWETAGPNDAFYDLATISVFRRMEEPTCLRLLSAYEGTPVSVLPAAFVDARRTAATLCGTVFLDLARRSGHPGAQGTETVDSVNSLSEFYEKLMSGSLNIATGEGRWSFGLALLKESARSSVTICKTVRARSSTLLGH